MGTGDMQAGDAQDQLTGGRLNAAIARGVVHMHSRFVGRGPTKAQAFFHGNVIVVVMRDTMTKSELSLVADGRGDAVLEMRKALQRTMEPDLVAAVETLTGCMVVAFMCANHVEPDLEAELFVLDRPVPGGPEPAPTLG
jgi:uncharacterized protein YbcI